MQKNRWWLVVPVALGVMIVNVVISVIYVVIYSYAIDPGHDQAYYEAHAQVAAPYSSIVAGMPLMYLAGRWIGNRFANGARIKAALLVWLVYFVIDLAVVLAAGAIGLIALPFAVSFITKFAGAYLGGRSAKGRHLAAAQ